MAPKMVFLVEDEAILLYDLEELIGQFGYGHAGSASSVDQALAMLGTGPKPDIALLDLNLNGKPSYPIAEQLAAAGVPLVFLSGYGRQGLDERFSAYEVLSKPYDEETLLMVLERILGPRS
jgi:CheY-like chemotaxis protein